MTVLIINPGSHVEGGTEDQALANAREWLATMRASGITDPLIGLDPHPVAWGDGRWTFVFRHLGTGVECHLSIHGLSADEVLEYERRNIAGAVPRVYWKGSSCANPHPLDWMAPGHVLAIIPDPEHAQ